MQMQDVPVIFKREDGAAGALVALLLPALLGATTLAVDVGWIYVHNAKLQHVSDASSLGGAMLSLPNDLDTTNIEAQVETIISVADANVNDSLKTHVLSAADVTFGCWAGGNFTVDAQCADGLANAVRVTARENGLALFFASLIGYETIDLAKSAVAAKLSAPACLITLNNGADALRYDGGITLDMPSCGIHVNGEIAGANNMPTIDTTYLCAGSASKPTITTHPKYREHCGSLNDPYSALTYSTSGLANMGSFKPHGNGSQTINPGVYSDISVGGNLTLTSGKYVVDGGQLSVKGNVIGDGVTIILKNGATLDLGGSASITLRAPTTGDTKGFVLIENDGNPGTSELGGTSFLEIDGSIYLKDQKLVMKGNPNIAATDNPWSSMVVDKLDIRGNSEWSLRPPTGAEFDSTPQLPTQPRLVQ
jgi:Flp pilus assembly protein TadG